MILPLTYYPDPILRKKGLPVKAFDEKLLQFADDMLETMDAHNGVGLAAQQVGQALQFAVVDVTDSEEPSGMTVAGKAVDPEEYMPLFLVNATVSGTKAKERGPEAASASPACGPRWRGAAASP
jgi:peptide deformylase